MEVNRLRSGVRPGAAERRARKLPLPDQLGTRYAGGVVLLIALYYAAGWFSNGPLAESKYAPIVFLPMGVGIAFLYVAGLRYWPGVLIGSLITENAVSPASGQAFGFALAAFIEIVVATVLLRRFVRRGRPLDTVDGVAGMVAAIAAGEAVGATIGCLTARLSHALTTSGVPAFWRTWWLAGFCGGVLLVPMVLAWCPWPQIDVRRRPSWDAILPLAAVAGLSALVFQTSRPWSYLVFPALMWTALRLGQRGATVAVVITGGVAVWATTHFFGPFRSYDASRTVIDTQLFIAVSAVSTVCFAALATDRERLAGALRASLLRVVQTSESERRRLEHDLHDGAQQRLVAIQIKLGLAKDRAASGQDITEELSDIELDAAQATEELRALAHGIYPSALSERGPIEALRRFVRSAPVSIHIKDGGIGRCSPIAEAAIYFCALEATQNAIKHAGPNARVEISLIRRRNAIELAITDDGVGMTAPTLAEGFGMVGMRDRIGAIGGRLDIISSPGAGTNVRAMIPMTPQPISSPGSSAANTALARLETP